MKKFAADINTSKITSNLDLVNTVATCIRHLAQQAGDRADYAEDITQEGEVITIMWTEIPEDAKAFAKEMRAILDGA